MSRLMSLNWTGASGAARRAKRQTWIAIQVGVYQRAFGLLSRELVICTECSKSLLEGTLSVRLHGLSKNYHD